MVLACALSVAWEGRAAVAEDAAANAAAATAAPDPAPPGPRDGPIRFLEDRVRRDPDDIVAQNRLASEYLAELQRTGDLKHLDAARRAVEASLRVVPAELNVGALAARGRVEYESHDFAAARDSGKTLVAMEPEKPASFMLLGDALLELGDYASAAEVYARMEQLAPNAIGVHARLARLDAIRGDDARARKRLEAALAAARELTPASPDVVAWCHVKLGESSFGSGDWDTADRHYRAALETAPGVYTAVEHLGELRAAQGRYGEAAALYADVVRRVPRPEFLHALGDVYQAAGRIDEAKPMHARALAAYVNSAEAGGAHYYHHLAGYYCDTEPDAGRALHWARKDMEVRQSVFAHGALARALYLNGEFAEAAKAADASLAQGTRNPHLLYHASLVYFHAGEPAKAKDCLARAAVANAKFTAFHVHR